MKISELNNKKKSLSFEIFPPKKDSELKNIDATLDILCELEPDFISVTFGAGGSSNCNRTIELAKKIKQNYHVEPVVHLTCLHYNKAEIDEYRFVEDCRIADINVPIVSGIMPVINAAQIKRMITMCGASFPERFQRIIHKFEDNKAALFDAGMSYALSQIIDLLANDTDGIHLYTMNNPVVARKICEGIQNII